MNTRLVIFDMDGTLTKPYLDFVRIRREIQAAIRQPLGEPILEAMRQLDGESRRVAFEIMERFEDDAASQATLNDGAKETLEALRSQGLKLALMTNNRATSVQRVVRRFSLRFDFVYSREVGPAKPDPRGVLTIIDRFDVPATAAIIVGDYKWEILAGRAAGVRTCLLHPEGRNPFDVEPDHTIRALPELVSLLR